MHPIWKLCLNGEEIGRVTITDGDGPWLSGTLHSTPALEAMRPLFQRELELCEWDDDWQEWERAYFAIRRTRLELVPPDRKAVAEFLLHIDGDRAWFRWSDEPFDDGG
jgi:hypothetical protein